MKEVDVVSSLLRTAMEAFPNSEFIQSLSHQYLVRGWLSKKQLQGLYSKLQKASDVNPGKMATLEAQILKMPNRYKSEMPETKPMFEKDEAGGNKIKAILEKYPQHKRVLYFLSRYENNELTSSEVLELEKLFKLLVK
jgi:hypothetical protein